MNKNILFITLLLLVACANEHAKKALPSPGKTDIEEIVKVIVLQDSLNNTGIPLSQDLTKINLELKDCDTISPIGHESLNINRLLRDQLDNHYFFAKRDSSDLVSQNKIIKSFKLDSLFLKIIKLTNNKQVQGLRKAGEFARYYEITLPLFSSDGKKAWVELNDYCPLCGYGLTIFLEKIRGHWTILHQAQNWIS